MSYFDPPPDKQPEETVVPEWWLAPRGELGEEIPYDQLIAESDRARVTLRALVVYSNGFELLTIGEWVGGALGNFTITVVEPHSERFLRIAVEFADGRRATNMDETDGDASDDTPPGQPFMTWNSQHFTGVGHADIGPLWVWWLPPEGDLTVVREWPADIPVTKLTIDGDRIRTAARSSLELWPDTTAPEA